jgi:putative endonuclease
MGVLRSGSGAPAPSSGERSRFLSHPRGIARGMNRNDLGALGESLAARFLGARGCRIVDRNVVVPNGELDLIVLDGRQRVAVEVRSRWGEDPLVAFDESKLERVRRSARVLRPRCTRIDLVTVSFGPEGVDVRWLPDL